MQADLPHVDGQGHADLSSQLEPVVAYVCDDHEARAVMARHDRGHQADGPGARDEHVLCDQAVLRRRMDRIAERVEDRGDVEVDLGEVGPQVARRHDDELGEGSVALHPDAYGVGAQHPASGQTVAALAARDVALGADDLAGVDGGDTLTELDDLADELVADDQRGMDGVLGPLVPAVDVQVGAADPCTEDADQHLTRARLRLRYVLQPQPRLCLCFHQRLHRWWQQ